MNPLRYPELQTLCEYDLLGFVRVRALAIALAIRTGTRLIT